MAIDLDSLKVVHYPDPVLRKRAQPVDVTDPEVLQVARRMVELMHDANGVGLAAPQIGLSWRIFVTNHTGEPGDDRIYLNPELTEPSRQTHPHEEGCLSLPEIVAEVTRPTAITLTATDLEGQSFTMTDDGFLARVWQHEFDHLEGTLILDKMTPFDRKANRRAVKALEDAYRP